MNGNHEYEYVVYVAYVRALMCCLSCRACWWCYSSHSDLLCMFCECLCDLQQSLVAKNVMWSSDTAAGANRQVGAGSRGTGGAGGSQGHLAWALLCFFDGVKASNPRRRGKQS